MTASYGHFLLYLHLAGIELLLPQVLTQSVPVTGLLLAGEFAQRIVSDVGVVAGHAQGTAPLAGHTGEALPPGEVVNGHNIETHPLPSRRQLGLSEDGRRCTGAKQRGERLKGWLPCND